MKKLIVLLLLIGCLAYGCNEYAPQMAESALHHSLQQKMELQRSDVRLEAEPGIKIVAGTIDRVQVHGRDARIGDMKLASLDCDLRGVHFDPIASVSQGSFVIQRADSGELSASIRSDDLKQFLMQKVDKLSDVQVDIVDDSVHVKGNFPIGGILDAKADIRGHFGMEENKLMFVPNTVSLEGLGIAYKLKLNNIEVYDFSGFPLGIIPDTVSMQDNVLTIHGRVRK